jgi:hypothetical protein
LFVPTADRGDENNGANKMNRRFWRIECEEGMKKYSSMIVYEGQISVNKIEELMRILFAKYILTDEEILSSLCKKKTLRFINCIHYSKYLENLHDKSPFRLSYCAQSSGISITIELIYQDELTKQEKEKIKNTSTIII